VLPQQLSEIIDLMPFEKGLPMCSALLVGKTSVDEALDGLMGRAEADIEPVREILISGSGFLNQSQSDDQIRGP